MKGFKNLIISNSGWQLRFGTERQFYRKRPRKLLMKYLAMNLKLNLIYILIILIVERIIMDFGSLSDLFSFSAKSYECGMWIFIG